MASITASPIGPPRLPIGERLQHWSNTDHTVERYATEFDHPKDNPSLIRLSVYLLREVRHVEWHRSDRYVV